MRRDEPSSRKAHQVGWAGSAGRQACLSVLPSSAKLWDPGVRVSGWLLFSLWFSAWQSCHGPRPLQWALSRILTTGRRSSGPFLLLQGLLPCSLNLPQPLQGPGLGGDITEPVSGEPVSPSPAYQDPSITPGTCKQAVHRGLSNGQQAQGRMLEISPNQIHSTPQQ